MVLLIRFLIAVAAGLPLLLSGLSPPKAASAAKHVTTQPP
jgi:hypothetical protein